PDGIAVIYLNGKTLNARRGVPDSVLRAAIAWVVAHEVEIRVEWLRLDNPEDRGKRMSKVTTVYRIAAVTALPAMRLRVEYVGGNIIEVELASLIARSRAMGRLANPDEFNTVRVGDYGWTVVWNDDTELSSDRLMEMALEQQGRTDALEFRRWQERNRLSLSEA